MGHPHGGHGFVMFRISLSICRKFLWFRFRYMTNFPRTPSYNGTYLTKMEKAVPGNGEMECDPIPRDEKG